MESIVLLFAVIELVTFSGPSFLSLGLWVAMFE